MNLEFHRHRRLRGSAAIRGLVRETRLHPEQLVYPVFVTGGTGVRREIPSMPGVCHLSLDMLLEEAAEAISRYLPHRPKPRSLEGLRRNLRLHPDGRYRGQYHAHPYGEFNMVVPLGPDAALNGPNGWCHAGWTAPAPGSHHYPEARGGAVIALFFLPAGRIAYHPAPQEEAAEHGAA